ncbi:hypothetical protein AVEN_273409-1 [Araneus ventricosus]|uniref:Uncharacterized protein n=1 Tax=Araneus ventricosus TaxID=182803 RepID=A0A4Y2E1N3_ARAVE|nr:hypothetical protein AVEN_273409-1 [Araneus ventricosus]
MQPRAPKIEIRLRCFFCVWGGRISLRAFKGNWPTIFFGGKSLTAILTTASNLLLKHTLVSKILCNAEPEDGTRNILPLIYVPQPCHAFTYKAIGGNQCLYETDIKVSSNS